MSYKILISAGEVSGDQHLARVVAALRQLAPGCHVRGMAGRFCQEAGAEIDIDCYRAGAGMGFFELFRSGGKILSSFKSMSKLVREWKPDLLIVVDYPDFNLRLAKVAKRAGVKVLYFIPPKVWAWRSGRVKKIRQYVDRIAAIFPFEPSFYAKHGYESVTYVGHPLAEKIPSLASKTTSATNREEAVLLLPGSRRFEVERMLVPMLQGVEIVRRKFPALKPIVLLAPNIEPSWVRSLIGTRVSKAVLDTVEWSHAEPINAMQRARVGVLKSGTCNLEGAIAGLPFVCVYSGTHVAKVILSLLVSLKEYSPVNIIRPHTVSELMQVALSPGDLARELEALVSEGSRRAEMERGLAEVRAALKGDANGASSVSERVARCALEMIGAGAFQKAGMSTGFENV